MKRLLGITVLVLLGCGGSSPPTDRLLGNWIYESADGSSGIGATFRSDGTYSLVILQATSTTTANAELENGSYVATASSFTTTPKQWTCPSPDPVTTVQYSFSGSTLVTSLPTGAVSFVPNSTPATGAVALTYGCLESGTFAPEALAPVTN